MAQKILPFLSGTLREIIDEVSKKDDPIAKEIYRIDKLIEETIKIYDKIPERLADAIKTKLIDEELTGEVIMLSCRIGQEEPNISFLPKGKEPEYTENGTWARRNRQEGKPAKIFQKALVRQFKQREWELFANAFKAEVCNCNNFELVSGEDIRKWYFDENYYECSGTLGNSCMRYYSAQDYFDVYVDNAKMLITKKAGKLTGRAIVWEIDENTTILDRIYTCFDYLENCFIDYAKEHKWIIRENNSLLHTGEEQCWRTPDDNYSSTKKISFTIKLKNHYDQFPYVDSFRYYNDETNILTTEMEKYALDSTDGDFARCSITCDNCGYIWYGYDDDNLPDEVHYSEWTDGYVCDHCSYWCELIEDYIPDHVPSETILHKHGCDHVPSEIISDYLITSPDQLVAIEDAIVKIGDKFYFYDDYRNEIIYNLDKNEYEIRSHSN